MLQQVPGEQDRYFAKDLIRRKAEGGPLDVAECEREPIHIPGAIQPHGALLAFDRVGLRVKASSANAGEYIGSPASALLGRSIAEIFPDDFVQFLTGAAADRTLPNSNPIRTPVTLSDRRNCQAWLHERNGVVFVELERSPADDARAPEVNTVDRRLLQMRQIESLDELRRSFVLMVREMTGFERVLLYAFR